MYSDKSTEIVWELISMNLNQRRQLPILIWCEQYQEYQEYHYDLPSLKYYYNILFLYKYNSFYEYTVPNPTSALSK